MRTDTRLRDRNLTDNRVFPDRDISPERYMKPIPKIGG